MIRREIGMNERIERLRKQSVSTDPSLSIERAVLLTQAYEKYQGSVSTPVLRALSFKHILENKTIIINDDELIVGERGPSPQATPTYPELCAHTLEDLDIISQREKIFFKVDDETRKVQEEKILPYWKGRSIRDRLYAAMDNGWMMAYEAGVFTEFMEQRAPGHTVADDKIYQKGFLDIQQEIQQVLDNLEGKKDLESLNKLEELKAMAISSDALIRFAQRHSEMAAEMAETEADEGRKAELLEIAAVCRRVPAHAPRTFREALQMYWFVHLGIIIELNTWDSFSPGKLDQHLYHFYKNDMDSGELTKEQAKELLECYWIKANNQPAPPKVGITLKESATYTDFSNINIGGVTPDGEDAVNEISYLLLEIIDEMRTLQPSSNVQISQKTPDRFLVEAVRVIREGMGYPSIFNSDAVVEELVRQGKSLSDARSGGNSGCVETGAFGKEAYILTGYFNLVKVLELTLNNGMDPITGKGIGLATGNPESFKTMDDLMAAYNRQLNHFIDIKIRGNHIIEKLYGETMPAPFMSTVIDDCIAKGKDYNAGGARYNTRYIQMVGIGSLTDSLSALDKHVFKDQRYDMQQMIRMLNVNFSGYEKERQLIIHKTSHYGNDHDEADQWMVRVFNQLIEAVDGRPTVYGGHYRVEMLPTTSHVYFGSVIGATPDGRLSGKPLSEGISPVQGRDVGGPTAVLKSAAKMDHIMTGGTLLNQKFSPSVLEGEKGLENLKNLIRSYFKMNGHHLQFNVVDAATLREAQSNPEAFRSLIVRVAGYSDYFGNLSSALQNEIIERTEHGSI